MVQKIESLREAKKAAGYKAADLIENKMLVGLGTGTTVFFFIERLAERVKEGLDIQALPTSRATEQLAKLHNIPLLNPLSVRALDIAVDGADEIDENRRMIKGGGGALLREKIVAAMAKEFIVIVDSDKAVVELGRHPLPVEILPFGLQATIAHLEHLGFNGHIREQITDNENYIFDIQFADTLKNPEECEEKIKKIPGVLETGFFFNLASRVIVGYSDKKIEIL